MDKNEIQKKLTEARKLVNEVCNNADYIENDELAEDFSALLTNMDGDFEDAFRILAEDS